MFVMAALVFVPFGHVMCWLAVTRVVKREIFMLYGGSALALRFYGNLLSFLDIIIRCDLLGLLS